MLSQWINFTKGQLVSKYYFHVSSKRLSHDQKLKLTYKELLEDPISLDMLGFSKRKISMLTEYYFNEESVIVAKKQLAYRREKNSYGSTGVTCYNHFSKKERPMHGPCIQSIVFTHIPNGNHRVDIFYRTTEVFKKFAADLIWLRDIMLPQFKLQPQTIITFHFASTTFHPMYWAVVAPYLGNPVVELGVIRKIDPIIWRGIIRWTNRFLSESESLEKFKQGLRVSKHLKRLMDPKKLKQLEKYVTKKYNYIQGNTLSDEEDDDDV